MSTVTVIIPTYNREKRIERTLMSVLDQDYSHIEIIVVDDGSTDNTESVIRSLASFKAASDKCIRYYRQVNQGACVARNRGMMLATGSYIMFLDSDDLIKSSYLRSQVNQIELNGCQCSICDFEYINEISGVVGHMKNNRHPHDFIRGLISPSISTVLMRRDSIPPGLQWNTRLKVCQDIDFMYKYFSSIETYSYVAQYLFLYCLHGDERISDKLSNGLQYGIMIRSFKEYIENNKSLISANSNDLYTAYKRSLKKHQLKNFIVGFVPLSLKKMRKQLKSKKFGSNDPVQR